MAVDHAASLPGLVRFQDGPPFLSPMIAPIYPPFFDWSALMRNNPLPDPEQAKLKDELREKAGKNLLQWIEDCPHAEYEPCVNEPTSLRAEQHAYIRGYNDCRAEAMRVVADLILERDVDNDDDSGCDCC